MSLAPPHILDVTVRDGSYLLNHQFSPEAVANIVRYLDQAGVEFAEVSHGCGIGSKMMGFPGKVDDDVLLEAAKNAAPNLKLSAFIAATDYSLPLIPALVDFLEMGRVGVNVDQIPSAEKVVQKLKKYKKTVSIQLVRTHARSPKVAAKSAKQAADLGADIVYLVDTFGSFLPTDVKAYVESLRSVVNIPIGFHGHNNIGMAISNSLAAWEAGATWLDASLMGVGRGAGNTVLEILAAQIQSRGFGQKLQLDQLFKATQEAVLPIFFYPTHSSLADLLFSKEKIDMVPESALELLAITLHMRLDEFVDKVRAKMGDAVQLTDAHLKSLVQDAGFDYDQIAASLKEA